MRHSFLYIPALFAITACGNMDDFPELAAISEQEETEVTVNLTDTIRINETPLSGEVETVPSATAGEDGYKDFVENFLYDDDSGTWDDGVKTLELITEDGGDDKSYITESLEGMQMMFYNDEPIGLTLPASVVLKVIKCDPGVRGNSATSRAKPATVETGFEVMVPEYLEEGELIKVDTRTGEYSSRA